MGGLLLGLSRACVAEFTFYLAIPVMAGASLLKVVKFAVGGSVMTGTEVAVLAVGCVVAFGVSLAAIRFLMDYVKRHDFKFFGDGNLLIWNASRTERSRVFKVSCLLQDAAARHDSFP